MTRPAEALAAALVGAAVAAWPPLGSERTNADWLAAAGARWRPARLPAGIALVVVDAPTLSHPAFAGRPRAEWAEPLATVVERALAAGAMVVGIDLVLPRDDVDHAWLAVLRRARAGGRLVLGTVVGPGGATPSRAQRVAAGGVDALAAVNIVADDDGIVRRMPPAVGGVPTLGSTLARRAGAETDSAAPLAYGALPAIPIRSAASVLDCGATALAGRVVIVGAWLPFEDRHATGLGALPRTARTFRVDGCDGAYSVAAGGNTPGVLLHALAFAAWRDGGPSWLPKPAEHALVVGAAMSAGACAGRRRLAALVTAVGAWSVAAVVAAPTLVLPWLGVTVAAAAGLATLVGIRAAWSAREIAASLPGGFRDAPRRACVRDLTACFIDIASFTSATEAIADPARVARELAACLAAFEAIVVAHRGHVDKYLGDGLLAWFDAAGDGPAQAVAAARACAAACAGPRAPRYGGRPVAVRIGLAHGPARIGPLGKARLHFTAVGDPLNLAARLEQLNKALGTTVLADAAVAARTPDAGWRDRGEHVIRGRRGPVRVYELTVADARL